MNCKWCGKDKDTKYFQIVKNTYTNKAGRTRTNITRRKVCTKCMNDVHTKDYVRRQREGRTDFYMRHLIHHATKIPHKLIPQEMITFKRNIYELKKEIESSIRK